MNSDREPSKFRGTVISGSLELPEVRGAMEAAAQHFVQLDELTDAVGKRLAELTGAEYGMVSAGCAAAIADATGMRHGRQSRSSHSCAGSEWFCERRSRHPLAVAECLRSGRPIG